MNSNNVLRGVRLGLLFGGMIAGTSLADKAPRRAAAAIPLSELGARVSGQYAGDRCLGA